MRIAKVGLEVEGGWDGEPGVNPFDIPLIADHSIDGRTLPTDRVLETTHVGEVVSKPMEPDKKIINEWIDKYWPSDANRTCGYHIHLSFDSMKDYTLLTRKSFLYGLRARMVKLGKELELPEEHYLFQRMNGGNPFAMLNFDASSQIALKHKSVGDRTRYGMINCCWGIHKTIEFRSLPTFEKKSLAKAFTEEYLDYVEEYLEANADKKIHLSAKLRLVNGTLEREIER